MLHSLKIFAPTALYIVGAVFFLMGFQKKGQWALLLLTFLIPLRNIIDRLQDLPLGNQFIDILIVSVIISWFVSRMSDRAGMFAPSVLNSLIIVLVAYTFLSLLLGSNYLYGTFSLDFSDQRVKDWKNFCLMPLLFLITLNQVKNRKWIVYILLAMAASCLLMNYYTILQIHDYPSLESREKIRGTFEFLGPNEVAAFFNEYTVIMLAVYLCIKPQWWVRLSLFALICINTFSMTFLYSRAAYLGYFTGLFIVFFVKNKKLLIPLVLVMVFWQYVLPEKAVERVKETKNAYGQLDESSERRVLIWQQALDLFNKNPITGLGFNVFGYLGLDLGDTHNIYVKYLVEQGLIGFVIFLVNIVCFFRMGYILYKKGEEDDLAQGMGLGLMACVFVLLVNNMFGNRWMYFELSAYLWIFAGLVARMIILKSEPAAVESSNEVNEEVNNGPKKGSKAAPVKKKKVRYYDL